MGRSEAEWRVRGAEGRWHKMIGEAREDISDLSEDSPGIFQRKRDEILVVC